MQLKKLSLVLLMSFSLSAAAGNTVANTQPSKPKDNTTITSLFLEDEPHFQADLFRQMQAMQQTMNQLMASSFTPQFQALTTRPKQLASFDMKDVVINKSNDKITYIIKIPESSDNNVDVKIERGQLKVSLNVTEKIIKETSNSQSVSYSQSRQSRSFQLPKQYDDKSMKTQLKEGKLFVTFKTATSKI